jgi:hypothetical protein
VLLPVALSLGTLPYLLVVLIMLLVEVVLLLLLVPRGTEPAMLAFGVLVATALVGSAGALLGVFWAVLYPNLNSFTIVFEALGISMGFPPGFWMISIIVYHDDRIDRRSFWWPLTLAAVATLGEILMGLVFTAALGPLGSAASVAAATLVSPWYLWSSALAMLALLGWIRLDPGRRAVLVGLALSGVAAPWVGADPAVGAGLMTAAMALTFAAIYWATSRGDPRTPAFAGLLPGAVGAYLAMSAAGVAVAISGGSDLALIGFGAVMTAVMFGELRYLLAEGFSGSPRGAAMPDLARETPRAAPAP